MVENLTGEEKIIFKFCQFILGIIVDQCAIRPITLLVAESFPTNPDLHNNFFNGQFSYDSNNRFLYVKKNRLADKNPGHLYVMMVHCTAHIKTGDLSNDSNPEFRTEFYKILAKISGYIFKAHSDPSIKYPIEFAPASNKLEFSLSEIRSIFNANIEIDRKKISEKLEEINYDLAMKRRQGIEDENLIKDQKKLQSQLNQLNIAINEN